MASPHFYAQQDARQNPAPLLGLRRVLTILDAVDEVARGGLDRRSKREKQRGHDGSEGRKAKHSYVQRRIEKHAVTASQQHCSERLAHHRRNRKASHRSD